MKKLLFWPLGAALLLGGAALPGCNGPGPATEHTAPATPEAQVKAAQDSLMAHHDRLMGQADVLIALAARLNAAPKPPRPLLLRINSANNAMMDWMHQYQQPDSSAPPPQRLTYLQDQQRQLAAIEQQMSSALDSARAVVDKLPPDPGAGPAVPLPDAKMPEAKK